jgi:hypothetical protein
MFHAKDTNPSSSAASGKQVTAKNSGLLSNVDHIFPHSDQEVLNRHLATLSLVGAVQPTLVEMHAAYKLIANMETMGLPNQFGPRPNPAALKEPLE